MTKALSGKLVCEVEPPAEFKDTVSHAESLGLSLRKAEAYGDWETNDGHPVFLKCEVDITKAGREYFHIPVDGKVTPVHTVDQIRQGVLYLTFTA